MAKKIQLVTDCVICLKTVDIYDYLLYKSCEHCRKYICEKCKPNCITMCECDIDYPDHVCQKPTSDKRIYFCNTCVPVLNCLDKQVSRLEMVVLDYQFYRYYLLFDTFKKILEKENKECEITLVTSGEKRSFLGPLRFKKFTRFSIYNVLNGILYSNLE